MIYHVYANRSNIGDWLSAKGIQYLIASDAITECLCDTPYVAETIDVLSKASEKDLIVIGGGGLLMDYFEPFWEAFFPIAGRVPFCIWGIGYCDLKDEPSLLPTRVMEEIINLSRISVVRDDLSRSYLPHSHLTAVVPCPSINVVTPAEKTGKDLLHVVNYSTAGAAAYAAMCDAASEFAAGHNIKYRESNNRVKKNRDDEMHRVLSNYGQSGLVLSSALHGCIIGVAMGLKVLAVSGDRKIEAFMDAVGLGDWVLDAQELHLIPQKLEALHTQQNPESILDEIRKRNQDTGAAIRHLHEELQAALV